MYRSPEKDSDDIFENELRPRDLSSFLGQENIKSNLKVFINSAKKRGEPLDHILFYGPPGLGKTTLSHIIAHEMKSDIKVTSAPSITKTGELAGILTNLQEGDVLFIDEIHRLNKKIEEVLYSAMEDFRIDIMIGEGAGAKIINIPLQKFTLIGATTKLGNISSPLRDRFSIPLKFSFYDLSELQQIIAIDSNIMEISIDEEASERLALCSRGTPRIAIRLLKRIRDFAIYENKKKIDLNLVIKSLKELNVDEIGLDLSDNSYLNFIYNNYGNSAVGIETIASGISEEKATIEDSIEPYLIQIGFVKKTPKGRSLTDKAIIHINKYA